MSEGYTVEDLRTAFRHGAWYMIAVHDGSVTADDVTKEVVDYLNSAFDMWLETGLVTASATTTVSEQRNEPENEKDKSKNTEDSGEHIADR